MKTKKLLSLIMAVLMIAAIPVSAFAASTSDIYHVYANGIKVTEDNCDDVLGDGGSVKYDKKNSTITLTNAKITKANQYAGMSWYGLQIDTDTTHKIELVGNNVIDLRNFKPETDNTVLEICALSADGTIEFYGNGSLKLYTPDCNDSSALDYGASLYFDGCKVEIHSGDGWDCASGIDYSISPNRFEHIGLENGAELKVYAGNIENKSRSILEHEGIRCSNLKVDKTSKCYVETGDVTMGDIEYATNVAITAGSVFGGGEVTALAGKVTYTSAMSKEKCVSCGIYDIGWPMSEEHANGRFLADMTIIASGYDCGTYSTNVYLYDMSDKIDILVSENIDGSDLKHLKDGERLGNYKYVMICPEDEVVIEEEEKSFFEMVIDFFVGIFNSIVNFFLSLL